MIIYLIGFIVFGISALFDREYAHQSMDDIGIRSDLVKELLLMLVVIFWPLILIYNIFVMLFDNLVKS